MKSALRALAAAALSLLLAGCPGIHLVSPYDEAIEKGILEFQEQLNNLVKNAGDLAGTPEGYYDAHIKGYNALETKVDLLIQRAGAAAEGKACKLEAKIQAKLREILKTQIPAELQGAGQEGGNTNGCNTRMLENVKVQVAGVRRIHSAEKCPTPAGQVSCLRAASAKDALAIANQAIHAVYIVEVAKKN